MEAPPPSTSDKDGENRGGKSVGLASFFFDVYWDLKKFFRSPFNRFCLMGSLGFGFYMYQQHLNHQWRMSEMQRRIDANLVYYMIINISCILVWIVKYINNFQNKMAIFFFAFF